MGKVSKRITIFCIEEHEPHPNMEVVYFEGTREADGGVEIAMRDRFGRHTALALTREDWDDICKSINTDSGRMLKQPKVKPIDAA